MTENDYKMIAEVIKYLWWERDDPVSMGRKAIAEDFADAFREDVTAFDKKKFLEQCGVER